MSRKMHELLAVEADLQKMFLKVSAEAKETFSKRSEHFRGHDKSLKMKDDSRAFEEAAAHEHKEVDSTVGDKLRYASKSAKKYFDALLQKESANQVAKADLIVEGKTLATQLPATFLLAMESRLKTLREYYAAIPTHQPGVRWIPDSAQREGVFVAADDDVREKTEKDTEFRTVASATKEHPAQVAQVQKTVVVGLFTTKKWSGMISPGEKSELLARIDTLYQAVKQARQRANQVKIESLKIGADLFDFILEGKLPG